MHLRRTAAALIALTAAATLTATALRDSTPPLSTDTPVHVPQWPRLVSAAMRQMHSAKLTVAGPPGGPTVQATGTGDQTADLTSLTITPGDLLTAVIRWSCPSGGCSQQLYVNDNSYDPWYQDALVNSSPSDDLSLAIYSTTATTNPPTSLTATGSPSDATVDINVTDWGTGWTAPAATSGQCIQDGTPCDSGPLENPSDPGDLLFTAYTDDTSTDPINVDDNGTSLGLGTSTPHLYRSATWATGTDDITWTPSTGATQDAAVTAIYAPAPTPTPTPTPSPNPSGADNAANASFWSVTWAGLLVVLAVTGLFVATALRG